MISKLPPDHSVLALAWIGRERPYLRYRDNLHTEKIGNILISRQLIVWNSELSHPFAFFKMVDSQIEAT